MPRERKRMLPGKLSSIGMAGQERAVRRDWERMEKDGRGEGGEEK